MTRAGHGIRFEACKQRERHLLEDNSDFPRATESVPKIPSMAFWLNSYHFHSTIQTPPTAQRCFLFLNAFCKFHRDQFWHLKVTYLLKSYLLTNSLTIIRIFKCSFTLKKELHFNCRWFNLSKWKSQTQESARADLVYAIELQTAMGQVWWKFSFILFFDLTIQDEHQRLLRLSCFYITLMKTLYYE